MMLFMYRSTDSPASVDAGVATLTLTFELTDRAQIVMHESGQDRQVIG